MAEDKSELLNTVLAVTRDQLAKSMSLSAELEALLIAERKKSSDLSKEVASLTVQVGNLREIAERPNV